MKTQTLVPDAKETARLVSDLREGRNPPGRRLLRGLIHRGAIARGLSPAEALSAALSSDLDDLTVKFNVVFE